MLKVVTHTHAATLLPVNDFKDIYDSIFSARITCYDIRVEREVDRETVKSTPEKKCADDSNRLKDLLLFGLKLKFAFPQVLTWRLIVESLRAKIVSRNDVANEIEQRLS